MFPVTKNSTRFKYFLLIITLFLVGLACARQPSPEKIAVRIGDYTLTAGEFDELFSDLKGADDTPESRELFLKNLITRKILLQEAQRMGLDKQKDFLRSIENFWEQSLLKLIIDKKTKDISSSITVSEPEIEDHYNKWALENPEDPKTLEELRDIIRWQLLREKQNSVIDSWVQELKSGAKITIDKKAIGIE
jgi:hypothetical protein